MSNRYKLLSLGLGLAAIAALSPPSPGCIAIPMQPSDLAANSPRQIRLERQKAFLYSRKDTVHMLLSVQYEGSSGEFAWVIPVESKPEVDVQPGAPFHELLELTRIEQPRAKAPTLSAQAPGGAVEGVQVLERKEAGPYDLAVLRASTGGGLYEWLKKNGFNLTKNARAALDGYVQKDFVFVAARIRPAAQDNQAVSQRLRQGTIAPLHLSFRARTLSYPLRVTGGNPGTSQMELYVLHPQAGAQPNLSFQEFSITPEGKTDFRISGPPGSRSQGSFPTLRKLVPKGGHLVKYAGNLPDNLRQKDLEFARL